MPEERLHPDDYGMLTRATHAKDAACDHWQYVCDRLMDKYRVGPGDAIEPDGRITRAPVGIAK